jgi:hypothetical protein
MKESSKSSLAWTVGQTSRSVQQCVISNVAVLNGSEDLVEMKNPAGRGPGEACSQPGRRPATPFIAPPQKQTPAPPVGSNIGGLNDRKRASNAIGEAATGLKGDGPGQSSEEFGGPHPTSISILIRWIRKARL